MKINYEYDIFLIKWLFEIIDRYVKIYETEKQNMKDIELLNYINVFHKKINKSKIALDEFIRHTYRQQRRTSFDD